MNKETHNILDNIVEKCSKCGLCVESCDILKEIVPTSPGDIADQVLAGQIDENIRNYIMRCALCGLCVKPCPESLDIPGMVKAVRSIMLETGITDPEIFRAMWVDHDWNAVTLFRDTYQINLNKFIKVKCDTLLMPGCSLANQAPQLISNTIDWLTERNEGVVGLLPDCCGAPLEQMGLADRAEKYQDYFWGKIINSGAKKIVTACPACFTALQSQRFEKNIEVKSLYELMAKAGLRARVPGNKKITIHDSCLSRHTDIGKWVRQILSDCTVVEMAHHGENTICCGSGGMISAVDPQLHDERAERRIKEFQDTGADICITYCMACYHTLSQIVSGNGIKHLLELIFDKPIDPSKYEEKVKAMWNGEMGTYNEFRLRNSQIISK